ncbi:MAG: NADH-quinone oxidoreductase subunit J [Anaerolineae bacterium]
MITQVAFLVIALLTLGGAVGVVTARSVFVSALFLILSFVGVTGIYVLLESPFLAGVQLLIYVGAVAVLILFAVMLTRDVMSEEAPFLNRQWSCGGVIAATLLVLLMLVGFLADWNISSAAPPEDTILALGEVLLSTYVLPFEIASVILLVALIGAIVIARER